MGAGPVTRPVLPGLTLGILGVGRLGSMVAECRHTHETWGLEWQQCVRDYAFAHYPVPVGEWTWWLDREG